MNIKACDFYIHSQRKPEIMKIKVQDSIHNHCDVSSRGDFSLNIMNKSRKMKSFPIFTSSKGEHIYLSRNRDKEIFHKKLIRYRHKLIKKKLISDVNIIPDDFSYLNFTHSFVEEKQKSRHLPVFRKKNDIVHFSIKDVQATFLNKKSNMCLKPYLQTSSDFQSTFNTVPEKCKILKKLSKENLLMQNSVINMVRAFSSELNPTVHNDTISLNNYSGNESVKANSPTFLSTESKSHAIDINCDKNGADYSSEERKSCFEISDIITVNENIFSHETDRGSNWIQSLYCTTDEKMPRKMKLSNILPDGFANQMLKLQRREKSEKALQNYKINIKNKTIRNDPVPMIIISLLLIEDIAVTFCYSSNIICTDFNTSKTHFNEETCGNMSNIGGEKFQPEFDRYYFILFHKSHFHKQHLKSGSCLLLQPWHTIDLSSLQYPVILCKYFENITTRVNSSITDWFQNKNFTNVGLVCEKSIADFEVHLNKSRTELVNMFCSKFTKNLSLAARVQRIWNLKTSRLLLLLQTKDGIFHVLKFPNLSMHPNWQKCFQRGEGKCYVFENLKVAHRLSLKSCPCLFKFLREILKQNTDVGLNQDFLYKLIVDDISSAPCEIKETDFPVFLRSNMQPLTFIQKYSCQFERLSCVAKVLYQFKDILYITDESIFNSPSNSYVKVLQSKVELLSKGSTIQIKEAVLQEGKLILDQYSQFSVLHLSECELLNILSMKIPLKFDSSVSDLVLIGGQVIDIDESEACTWLQCNVCLGENLIQDTKNVIYCEDCSSILKKPILNVKMSVIIFTEGLPNALLNVQLLSQTIKQILNLNEETIQPQRSVKDVLGLQMNSLFCYIRGFEVKGQKKVFYLTQVAPV